MTFGALIIGDEILSGKRQDGHLGHVIETLRRHGRRLTWARIEGDDRDLPAGRAPQLRRWQHLHDQRRMQSWNMRRDIHIGMSALRESP